MISSLLLDLHQVSDRSGIAGIDCPAEETRSPVEVLSLFPPQREIEKCAVVAGINGSLSVGLRALIVAGYFPDSHEVEECAVVAGINGSLGVSPRALVVACCFPDLHQLEQRWGAAGIGGVLVKRLGGFVVSSLCPVLRQGGEGQRVADLSSAGSQSIDRADVARFFSDSRQCDQCVNVSHLGSLLVDGLRAIAVSKPPP